MSSTNKNRIVVCGAKNIKGVDNNCPKSKRTSLLKGTFGHLNSRIEAGRTISGESSDIRRYMVGNGIDDDQEEIEFNSSTSTSGTDKLKDSGVEEAESSCSYSASNSVVVEDESNTIINPIIHPSNQLKKSPNSNVTTKYDIYNIEGGFEFSQSEGGLLLDELPSGILDVDGSLIDSKLHVRFGQEDVDDSISHFEQTSSENNEKNLKKFNEVKEHTIPLSKIIPSQLQSQQQSSTSASEYKNTQNSTNSPRNKLFSRFLHRKATNDHDLNISPPGTGNKQILRLDFHNPYKLNEFNNEFRRHVGGSSKVGINSKNPMIRNKSNMSGTNESNNNVNNNNNIITSTNKSTITQHYYPEGGWGYVILFTAFITHTMLMGLLLSSGIVILNVVELFHYGGDDEGGSLKKIKFIHAVWLGVISLGISLLFSPIWIAICKCKSTRLVAVFGGLIVSLGCLFTSFASQFHQLFFSFGIFIGIGVGLTRDASSLMVGQYFKRKRELVEIILVSSSGFGILIMSESLHFAICSLGWRLGLQAITGFIFLTFFLGSCYRSASLYHPQRRAILHLKNQKRKIKEKEKRPDEPPFLDFSSLKSKTLQILLTSTTFISFGIYTPLFFLASYQNFFTNDLSNTNNTTIINQNNSFGINSIVHVYAIIGTFWIIGCILFGLIIIQKNQDCHLSKQYLCQVGSAIAGISILSFPIINGFNGLVIFSIIYGGSLGAYHYILKIYTYEKVRARHFPRAWSFVQFSTALPIIFGVPISGYLNIYIGSSSGYYLAALSVFVGSFVLFATDVRKRQTSRRKTANSSIKTSETFEIAQTPSTRRASFPSPIQNQQQSRSPESSKLYESSHSHGGQDDGNDPVLVDKELTCISEEGIADMDFQDLIYDDEWSDAYFDGDCITSCNKVEFEDFLISEFDPEHPMLQGSSDSPTRQQRLARNSTINKPILKKRNVTDGIVAIAGGIAGLTLQQTRPTEIPKCSSRTCSKDKRTNNSTLDEICTDKESSVTMTDDVFIEN